MCGLAGLLDPEKRRSQAEIEAVLDSMGAAIRHRGPDDHGIWADSSAGVGFASRRLAVIDLSDQGHQPMKSRSGRYTVAYNGEIFNHEELRRDLSAQGVRFRGGSDTETLLEAIDRWGPEPALHRFNGMFAFALWDAQDRTLRLARDRMGEKPLYFGWWRGSLLFASELKAVEAVPGIDLEVDAEVVDLFMQFRHVPGSRAIYKGFEKLPPGTSAVIGAGGSVHSSSYWSLDEVARAEKTTLDTEEATGQFEELLRRAVGRRMIADVPVGAFLSGGTDSSTVVALMQAQSSRPIRTFTIGFEQTDFDEAPFAARVAHRLGTDHTEMYFSAEEASRLVPDLPSMFDEPFADSSQLPTALVCATARAHVTVALTGDGGDELLGGYGRYRLHHRLARPIELLPLSARRAAARVLSAAAAFGRPGDRLAKAGRLLAPGGPEALYTRMMSLWAPGETTPVTAIPHRPALAKLKWPLDLMLMDALTYLPDDLLVKVDRAAMAVSLETRVPLVDHELVEFSWRMPSDLRVGRPGDKELLRTVAARYIGEDLLDRPKMGFAVPLADWLRKELRPWAEHLLSDRNLKSVGLLDPGPIRRAWNEHTNGQRDWKNYVWTALMLQGWALTK